MSWGAKLQQQRSCHCVAAVDVGTWCKPETRSIRLGRRSYMEGECDEFVVSVNMPRWRVLWRRIKKEKKKIFNSSVAAQVPYDPQSYSQNFDHGLSWAEPDNLSRSFSARFANPSRVFQRNALVT